MGVMVKNKVARFFMDHGVYSNAKHSNLLNDVLILLMFGGFFFLVLRIFRIGFLESKQCHLNKVAY